MQPCEKTEGIVTSLKQKLTFRYQGAPELPLWIQWLAPEWWNCGQQKQQISVKEAYLSFVAWTLEYSETILSENLIPECIEYFSQRGLDWNKVVQSSGGVRRTPFVYAIRNGSWDTSVAILDRVAVLDIDGEIKDIFSSLLQFQSKYAHGFWRKVCAKTQQRSSHEQAFQLLRLATDTTSFIRHKWFALFLQQCIDSDGEYGDVLQTNADGKSVLDDFGEESKLSVDAFARLGEYKKGIHVIHVHRRQRRMQIRTTLCTIYQSEHIHEIISIVTNYCLTENMSYDKWAASK